MPRLAIKVGAYILVSPCMTKKNLYLDEQQSDKGAAIYVTKHQTNALPLNFANGHRTINSSWHQRNNKMHEYDGIRSNETQNLPNSKRASHSMHSKIFLLFIQFQCPQIKPKERKWEKSVGTLDGEKYHHLVDGLNRVNLAALDSLTIVSVFIRRLLMKTNEEKEERALQSE